MEILLGIIVGIFVIISAVLIYMSCFVARPKVHKVEDDLNDLRKHEIAQGESLEIEDEHIVETYDGHKLWVGFVPGNRESKRYVVLSHGYTCTRYGMYKYVILWRRLGYNCVIYDNRGHGANQPTTVTFGIREGRDLMAVIEDTYERYGSDIRVGLHGESMGAGLQLMSLFYQPKVDFIINDCGYCEILPVLRWKVKQSFGLPSFLADWTSVYCRLIFGYRFEEVRPIECLKENEIPICFVHGTADSFTAHWHSEKMYEANKGYKELHLFEGVDHAECIVNDSKRYFEMMKAFVEKVYADVA